MSEKIDSAELLQQALDIEKQNSERLAELNKAFQEEFNSADTYTEQVEVAKKAVATTLPDAINTIQHLITNADSEGVRANLSKWVCDIVLSGKLDKSSEGELGQLLRQLTANDPLPTSADPDLK